MEHSSNQAESFIKDSAREGAASRASGQAQFFDDADGEFNTVDDLIAGLNDGRLLVHARVPDGTDFQYGIDPSAGEFLRSTDAWQTVEEEYGEGPELTFFSDSLDWARSTILVEVRGGKELELVFVRKGDSIQKSIGDGRVQLSDGSEVSYVMSPIADCESELYHDEPAGVERGDWYTNKSQDVVAVAPAAAILNPQRESNRTPNQSPVPQTETAAFKRWFDDSKVVDAEGKPLVVYHGTARDFAEFKSEAQGDNFGDYEGAFPRDGFWFTGDPSNAHWYANVSANGLEGERAGGGQKTIPAYLSIKNPYRYTVDMFADEGEAGIPSQVELEAQGYDGIIVEIAEDDDGSTVSAEAEAMWEEYTPIHGAPINWPADLRAQYNDLLDVPPTLKYTHYVAFRPEQIKSAIGRYW